MTQFGAKLWAVTAEVLLSSSPTTLVGQATVAVNHGWANFSDLAISHRGSGKVDMANQDMVILFYLDSKLPVQSGFLAAISQRDHWLYEKKHEKRTRWRRCQGSSWCPT